MTNGKPSQPDIVETSGLALVQAGERIFPDADSAAKFAAAPNVVNYYFPVEIEVIGPGTQEAFAETIYDALQREFSALG